MSRRGWYVAAEALCMVVVLGTILWLPFNWLEAYFCIGECAPPDPEQITGYRVALLVLGVAWVATVGLATARRAGRGYWRYAVLGLVGAAAAVLFAVPMIDVRDVLTEDPPPAAPPAPPCRSGPPNDCVGG